MTWKSLKATSKGRQLANKALADKQWKQTDLVGRACDSRQPISKFFTGKLVSREIFLKICSELGLSWEEIADLPSDEEPSYEELKVSNDIETLTQEVREKVKPDIEQRCGTMRVLDMTQPIGLDDIYTSVNILEEITGRIRVLSIEELSKNVSANEFERFSLGTVREKQVPGLEAVVKYSKLMILGKPGAGKTTFLKHLALLCIKGGFQENRIPLFITLKDFAEAPNQPNLFSYLIQVFFKYGITTNTDAGINSIEQLLKQGKMLVLLDGLDEVRENDSARVLKQIQDFTTDYPINQFVITCRIASREYTFQQFTEVEVADFNTA